MDTRTNHRVPDEQPGARPRRLLWIAVALSVVAAVALPVAFAFDADVDARFLTSSAGTWKFGTFFSKYGDWPWLMGYGVVLLAIANRRKHQTMRRIVICMMLASSMAGATNMGLKVLAGRTRPNIDASVPQGFYGLRRDGKWIAGRYHFSSFPSGHSAAAGGFLGVLFLAGPRLALLAGALLWTVPLARVILRAHHLSDVLAGTLLGLFFAALAWFVSYYHLGAILRRWRAR